MAITNLDTYIAAAKQQIEISKTASITAVGNMYTQVLQAAGQPGAGVLAGTSTTAGVVPTDATAGCPLLTNFGVGNAGMLGAVEFNSSVPCIIEIHDLLFKAGAYPFNAAVSLTGQPSFADRIVANEPTNLWIEAVTAFTGNQSIAVTYTNQNNVTGKTTGTIATGVAPIVGRMLKLPLASNDNQVKVVESVTSTVSTAGTFNVLVTRPIFRARVNIANGGDSFDFLRSGGRKIFEHSALILLIKPDSTATGLPSVLFDVVNG